MTTLLPNRPSLVLSPFSDRTQSPLFRQTHYFPIPKPCLRGSLAVARFGFRPDPEAAEGVVRELLGRAEGFLYTLADAAVSSSPSSDALTTAKQNDDWLSGIANYMESVLKVTIKHQIFDRKCLVGGISCVEKRKLLCRF